MSAAYIAFKFNDAKKEIKMPKKKLNPLNQTKYLSGNKCCNPLLAPLSLFKPILITVTQDIFILSFHFRSLSLSFFYRSLIFFYSFLSRSFSIQWWIPLSRNTNPLIPLSIIQQNRISIFQIHIVAEKQRESKGKTKEKPESCSYCM